jgi:hypothetical protein
MFGLAVIRNEDSRKGSTVSDAKPMIDGAMRVVVMWDDDYTFSDEHVGSLRGNPINLPKEQMQLTMFPGGKDETIN